MPGMCAGRIPGFEVYERYNDNDAECQITSEMLGLGALNHFRTTDCKYVFLVTPAAAPAPVSASAPAPSPATLRIAIGRYAPAANQS